MLFDEQQGRLPLPSGFIVSPALTPGQLLAASISAKPYNLSALPYSWFSADGGTVEGKSLQIEFCFFETLLVHVDLHVDAKQAKALHERLLERDLGAPHLVEHEASPGSSAILNVTKRYRYPWGEVVSQHSGNTFVRVEYAGRRQEAQTAFPRTRSSESLSLVQNFKNRCVQKRR